jgi:hypothetical protein
MDGRWAYIGAGAAPLAAGALVPVATVMDGPQLCPFRAATGLPCPLCGATRAFTLFGHGDASWVDYGAVWVVAAIVLIAIGLVRFRPPPRALAGVAVVAWAWALAHDATIT